MSKKEKLLIIFLSIVITFVGFNLIASSYAGLQNEAYEACYVTSKTDLAKCEVTSHQSPLHDESGLQFSRPDQDLFNSN